MSDGKQILRHWNLLRKLQTRGEGISLSQLATDMEVTERTVQRDFETLQELGFPIEHDADEFGKRFWRMPHDYFRSGPFVLSLTEAISLHLAERLLMPLAGTYLADGLVTVLAKVRSMIPQKAMDYFAALDETIYVHRTGVTDYSSFAGTIRTVVDAAREGVTIETRYKAIWRGDEYTTRFDPYGLVYYDGDLFALGRSHRANAIRIFKVTRILSAEATLDTFERPEGFALEDQFRSSFGIIQANGEPIDISVKFSGGAAVVVEERVWHESQQLSWQPADETLFEQAADEPETLVAAFRLSGVVEFKRWIKGFGDQAEVTSPTWLRAELRDELLAAAARHGA